MVMTTHITVFWDNVTMKKTAVKSTETMVIIYKITFHRNPGDNLMQQPSARRLIGAMSEPHSKPFKSRKTRHFLQLFYTEDGGTRLLRNFGNILPHYMTVPILLR
jgi:hypothetical protein